MKLLQVRTDANNKVFELLFSLLLLLTWMRRTVIGYILVFLQRVPYIGTPIAKVYPVFVVALAILALPWMLKHIRLSEVLIYLFAVTLIFTTEVFYPQNIVHIDEQLNRILTSVLPMIFLGVCYNHERHKKMLYWASLLGVVVMFSYQLYQLSEGKELMEDSMYAAYTVLPSALFVIYYAFERARVGYALVAVVTVFSLFAYGTRGPILCVLIFVAVALLLQLGRIRSPWLRVLTAAVIIAAVSFLAFTDVLVELSKELSKQFGKWGFSTRVFDYFVEGDIAEDSGRSHLLARAWAGIWDKPLFGHGLLGDRVHFSSYPHNLFAELWFQFGIIGGTIVIAAILILPIRALHRQRRQPLRVLFLAMLICMTFVKLMLSSSYILEPYFFFMLGVCLKLVREPLAAPARLGAKPQ